MGGYCRVFKKDCNYIGTHFTYSFGIYSVYIYQVDPIARYMYYEDAYLAGDLDPAFEVLTAFEMRLTTNAPAAHSDLTCQFYQHFQYCTLFVWETTA